jgi:U4/U6.U5 tri-snRNP-associated protein 3
LGILFFRSRSRSSSPHHHRRNRSRSKDRHQSSRTDKDKKKSKKKVEDLEDADDEAVMRKMGFAGFSTTKGKKVQRNDVSGSNIKTKNRYR